MQKWLTERGKLGLYIVCMCCRPVADVLRAVLLRLHASTKAPIHTWLFSVVNPGMGDRIVLTSPGGQHRSMLQCILKNS